MEIVWSGGVWGADKRGGGEDSFSIVNRNIVGALHSLGVDLRLDAWEVWDWDESYRQKFLDYDLLLDLSQREKDYANAVTIRQSWPVCEPYYHPKFSWRTMEGRRKIGFFVWESEHMPLSWIEAANGVDAIITISPFSAARVQAELSSYNILTPVWSVPLGVDRRVFHQAAEPRQIPGARSFRFLYVGDWQLRKGSDILLQAYLEEFTAADDVSLVIQSRRYNCEWTNNLPPNAPHILVIPHDNIPEIAMGGLYTACHCLVHPSRLEGFGMTMLEAMACGVPVLCPDMGGQRVFANNINSVLLPTYEEEFVFPFDLKGTAYHVEIPALRAEMRKVFQGGYNRIRVDNALQTAKTFSWERCAAQIVEHIEEMA